MSHCNTEQIGGRWRQVAFDEILLRFYFVKMHWYNKQNWIEAAANQKHVCCQSSCHCFCLLTLKTTHNQGFIFPSEELVSGGSNESAGWVWQEYDRFQVVSHPWPSMWKHMTNVTLFLDSLNEIPSKLIDFVDIVLQVMIIVLCHYLSSVKVWHSMWKHTSLQR